MTPKDQIIELLAAGVPTSQIAAAVGCTDSYVSQLRADPEVQAFLATKAVAVTAKDVAFDTALESAETMALQKLEKGLQFANFSQALAAFRVLNSARKRQDKFAQTDNAGTTINVNLTLPANAMPRYTLSGKNEIIEVEGQTMVTATPKSLDQILQARAAGAALPNSTAIERAANMLESMITAAQPQNSRAPRRVPLALSADIL